MKKLAIFCTVILLVLTTLLAGCDKSGMEELMQSRNVVTTIEREVVIAKGFR